MLDTVLFSWRFIFWRIHFYWKWMSTYPLECSLICMSKIKLVLIREMKWKRSTSGRIKRYSYDLWHNFWRENFLNIWSFLFLSRLFCSKPTIAFCLLFRSFEYNFCISMWTYVSWINSIWQMKPDPIYASLLGLRE